MKKPGRPSKITNQTVKKLEEAFALDCPVTEACIYAGISRQTYYELIKKKPELSDRFEQLKQKPILKARKVIIDKIGDSYGNAMDYLKRKRRAEFGDHKEIAFEQKTMGEILDEIEATA